MSDLSSSIDLSLEEHLSQVDQAISEEQQEPSPPESSPPESSPP